MEGTRRGRVAGVLAKLALLGVSSLFVIGAIEATLRAAPALLPSGAYGSGRYHPELRSNLHGGRVVYNKVRFVVREPNRDGFMDVDHDADRAPGVVRIGFFGDSYVEALQVPLEQVFFRRLAAELGERFETFGFGISGWGTFHAMRAWEVFGRRFGVDRVVYVFVENDLGDQLRGVGLATVGKPLLMPGRTGYEVHWGPRPSDAPLTWRAAKWLQRHSLLAHVVHQRMLAVAQGGLGRVREEQIEMSARAGAVPGANDLPGSWPEPYSRAARRLGSMVLADFARQVREAGDEFFVLYVPRGEAQLRGDIAVEDTWLPWLRETCAGLGIQLLDPSGALRERMAAGDTVYDDHWTPAGHEAIASVLAETPLAEWP